MCARSKIEEETDISAVQENKMQSQMLQKLKGKSVQEEAEANSHVAAVQEANSTFYRDILAIVTEKQRVMVWALYDRFGKWQQSRTYK
jgi:hypothetical protein